MEKVIENGKVAVLVSHGYGAGWYSEHCMVELLYDPYIVGVIRGIDETHKLSEEEGLAMVVKYCEVKYKEDCPYLGGVDRLVVHWIPQGTRFRIDQYDGAECIEYYDDARWEQA